MVFCGSQRLQAAILQLIFYAKNSLKSVFGWGFAPAPTGEAHSAPSRPLSCIEGDRFAGGEGGRGREGRGREGRRRGGTFTPRTLESKSAPMPYRLHYKCQMMFCAFALGLRLRFLPSSRIINILLDKFLLSRPRRVFLWNLNARYLRVICLARCVAASA
jgi:hypothetical protein